MKDIMTPVPAEEVRAVIKKCLENAALINYNKLASEAKVEGNPSPGGSYFLLKTLSQVAFGVNSSC